MRRLCGSESRMGASVELRVRGEASLLQRARACDNRRRGGSGDDGGVGGRAMTTWQRGQQFDSLLGVLVLLMLWERCGCENEQRESAHLRRLLEKQPRLWRRGDDGAGADAAKAGECGRARCARKTPCGGTGGICAGVRCEGAGARRGVVEARVHPAAEW